MARTKHWADPAGLIFESYRMEGITASECRTIFLDWALGMPAGQDMKALITALLEEFAAANPEHPMTVVLRAGLENCARTGRRGGWAARRGHKRPPPTAT